MEESDVSFAPKDEGHSGLPPTVTLDATMTVFEATSSEKTGLLNISFADDPKGSLGCQLNNCDKVRSFVFYRNNEFYSCVSFAHFPSYSQDTPGEMFLPGYATISKLLDGETVARKYGVLPGDCIVAVNGQGFRRFAPDYKEEDTVKLNQEEVNVTLDNNVVSPNSGYDSMLAKIKEIKANGSAEDPLVLSLERYGWDARANSWGRFLAARDQDVPAAMLMIQEHEQWKADTFPITLTGGGMQEILKQKAVSEIDVESVAHEFPPTVYVNYTSLMELQQAGSVTADDVVLAFVIFTELMLAKATDPRQPKTCQFIDLSGVSISGGLRVETLKKIYKVFEANYPETLFKMVMFPVSNMVATTARTLLSFVNEKTQKKFVITNSLETVCQELGWDQKEVEECGGVTEFMHKHEKAGTAMIFDD